MGLIRGALQALTIFDWTVLPRAAVSEALHRDEGGSCGFTTTNDSPALDLLRQHHIKTWAVSYWGHECTFRVASRDADKAERILWQAGLL